MTMIHWKNHLIMLLLPLCMLAAGCGPSPLLSPDQARKLDSAAKLAYLQDSTLMLYDLSLDTSMVIAQVPVKPFLYWYLERTNDSVVMVAYSGERGDTAYELATGKQLVEPLSEEDWYVLHGIVGSRYHEQFQYYKACYTAFNVHSKASWLGKTVEFRHHEYDQCLSIHTTHFDPNGAALGVQDSVTDCWGKLLNDWNYCDPMGLFESYSQVVDGRQIHSKRGNLYLIDGSHTELLLKNGNPYFNPKWGNGYLGPDLNPDGSTVAFWEPIGAENLYCDHGYPPEGTGIYEMDLTTREVRQLVASKDARIPKYSPGGGYLFYWETLKECLDGSPVVQIRLFNRSTGETRAIGVASAAVWM